MALLGPETAGIDERRREQPARIDGIDDDIRAGAIFTTASNSGCMGSKSRSVACPGK